MKKTMVSMVFLLILLIGWSRSGSRGLSMVTRAPSGSIVMYATGANQRADDGTGDNGMFTGQLLNNLRNQNLSVYEVFDKTMGDVKRIIGGIQDPELSLRFSGAASIYLGTPAALQPGQSPAPQPSPPGTGTAIEVSTREGGELFFQGQRIAVLWDNDTHSIPIENPGNYTLQMRLINGQTKTSSVTISTRGITKVDFSTIAVDAPILMPPTAAVTERPVPANMVCINGGTFTMGSPVREIDRNFDEGPQRQVTISSFYMGRYELTQAEYEAVMGTNPSNFKGSNLPVETVNWFDAIEYCNRLSQREGLIPAYTISGSGDNRTVNWNRSANGYRLPTEAEWEYACRAGTTTAYNTGRRINGNAIWYAGNSNSRTQAVGLKLPNAWG